MAKEKEAATTEVVNGVKRGTVVYVDGKKIGVNTSGEKEGGDGPNKDKLRTELVLDLQDAQYVRAVEHEDKRNESKPIKAADIHPGDRISAAWTDERLRVTSATVFPAERPAAARPKVVQGHLQHAPQRRSHE